MNLRLPSEAEWEYACRAGSGTVWWTGNEKESLKGAANLCDLFYHENEGDPTWTYEEWLNDGYTANAPVGSYSPNAFGLHDVHGNVWEWCKDSFADSYENTPIDGTAFDSEGSFGRVIRGGSWGRNTFHCRSALRYGNVPGYRDSYLGLRPAADLQQ